MSDEGGDSMEKQMQDIEAKYLPPNETADMKATIDRQARELRNAQTKIRELQAGIADQARTIRELKKERANRAAAAKALPGTVSTETTAPEPEPREEESGEEAALEADREDASA